MKTLYVSDLDGTLLHSDEKISEDTTRTINKLVEQGMIFSYATARSFQTARKVTKGLYARIPLITYNGAVIIDNEDGKILWKNCFGQEVKEVLYDLFQNQIFPIVYSLQDGQEKFSYLPSQCSGGLEKFIATRKDDIRKQPVEEIRDLLNGELFYITCIDEKSKLEPFYEKYKDRYHCVFQVDSYIKEQWLEIMPKEVSKANAIRQLQTRMGCDKLVVFGDGKNDTEMFAMADESYAVRNAEEELKKMATGVIDSNDEDGVARWLEQNFERTQPILTDAELLFFERMPQMLPLYHKLKGKLKQSYPEMEFKVTKTQISFRNRYVFAMASLPYRKIKGWPEEYLLVSFGLSYEKKSPRIAQATEAYPNRWTHHVIIEKAEDIDGELLEWIEEAYQFSMSKGRR